MFVFPFQIVNFWLDLFFFLSYSISFCFFLIPGASLGWVVLLCTEQLCYTGPMCTEMDKGHIYEIIVIYSIIKGVRIIIVKIQLLYSVCLPAFFIIKLVVAGSTGITFAKYEIL